MAPKRPTRGTRSARLAAELERALANVVEGVDEVVERPRPTAASLHRLHRSLRELRTWLALWPELVGALDRERLRPLDARVRNLARLVGQVRDRDVALALLDRLAGKLRSEPEHSPLVHYRARLRGDARAGRELIRTHLRAAREAGLFAQMGAVVSTPARPIPAARLRRLLTARVVEAHGQMVEAMRSVQRRPTMRRLHRLRIRVRRLRQLSQLSSLVDPEVSAPSDVPRRRLQRRLGHIHDIDVVLLDLDRPLQRSAWARSLQKERRRERRALAEALRE